jgi:hypothetical protein
MVLKRLGPNTIRIQVRIYLGFFEKILDPDPGTLVWRPLNYLLTVTLFSFF